MKLDEFTQSMPDEGEMSNGGDFQLSSEICCRVFNDGSVYLTAEGHIDFQMTFEEIEKLYESARAYRKN